MSHESGAAERISMQVVETAAVMGHNLDPTCAEVQGIVCGPTTCKPTILDLCTFGGWHAALACWTSISLESKLIETGGTRLSPSMHVAGSLLSLPELSR